LPLDAGVVPLDTEAESAALPLPVDTGVIVDFPLVELDEAPPAAPEAFLTPPVDGDGVYDIDGDDDDLDGVVAGVVDDDGGAPPLLYPLFFVGLEAGLVIILEEASSSPPVDGVVDDDLDGVAGLADSSSGPPYGVAAGDPSCTPGPNE
jgi:hypothetical protein